MDYLKIEARQTILLLNACYTPINFVSWKRAVILLLKNKAKLLSNRVIRLVSYIKLPLSKITAAKPTRSLIFKRDDGCCSYCGSIKQLTIDHIIPSSRGGLDTWENMTCCCYKCNIKKGNKTPEEVGMRLFTKPSRPFSKMILSLEKSNVDEWKEFIYT